MGINIIYRVVGGRLGEGHTMGYRIFSGTKFYSGQTYLLEVIGCRLGL